MTAAQTAAKAKFKKAIAYRQKTGVSLKEAFAHVYGKKVGAAPKKKAAKKAVPKKAAKKVVKKKAAPKKVAKKAAPKKVVKKSAPKKHTKYGKVKAHTRRVAGLHKDTKSHNVNIRVVSGVGKSIKIGSMPIYKDKDAAREIQLYADNDYQLYKQRKNPILINLSKKYIKGQYDINKAAKLWRYYIDAALQKYHKEFGSRGSWSNLLSVPDRNLLALEYAIETKNEFDLGNFTTK